MRHAKKFNYIIVVSIITILVLGASNDFVKADGGCGPCHMGYTTLVITTNATDGVDTSIGTPFTLIITAP